MARSGGGGGLVRWWRERGKAGCCLHSQQITARLQRRELLSSSKTACLQKEHTTRKDQLYWVSPRVLSDLQSCSLQVLGGGQPGAHGQHGIILACLRCFRVILSQWKLHSLTDSFFSSTNLSSHFWTACRLPYPQPPSTFKERSGSQLPAVILWPHNKFGCYVLL